MKFSRSILVWSCLAFCGLLLLTAMTWMTRRVLDTEKQRALAEARATTEECIRLALWRMDAAGSVIIAAENRHPPDDYLASSLVFQNTPDPLGLLHFQFREHDQLTAVLSPSSSEKLPRLKELLRQNSISNDEWSRLNQAIESGETAWKQLDKVAPTAAPIERKKENSRREDASYQSSLSNSEKVQRARNVEGITKSAAPLASKIAESKAAVLKEVADYADTSITGNVAAPTSTPAAAVDTNKAANEAEVAIINQLGNFRSAWIGDELFLLRTLSSRQADKVEKSIQGVWFDHSVLKARLLSEIKDLLPQADLVPVSGTTADPLALVSFPFRLALPAAAAPVMPLLSLPLLVGWAAVGLAILTTSLLVHGVMRLSERRASFVSAVTHELRTPLTTFRLYSDMLESGAVRPEKRSDYLRVLSREADRLAHLVENVLSFSQIERGSARSVVCETTISSLLEPMRERFESRLATAELTLEMDDLSDAKVRVDCAAIEHILFNLIDNAAKYAATSQPATVIIRATQVGKQLEISVTDHGPGIPISERRRIFRAFHKSAREAAETRPGVGLGLALSRRLAKSLGGSLECTDSQPGACFILRLPLA